MPLSIPRSTLYTGSVVTLATLTVLVVDCQATLAAPRGHVIELGWAVTGREPLDVRARLVKLPDGERVPRAVARITGITDAALASEGVSPGEAWRELVAVAAAERLAPRPIPTVAHFARFERPLLAKLAGGAVPLDVVCTHEIALRLFPELPRRSLRALAGYFGRSVGELRRAAEHVGATAFVWSHLVALLEERGVRGWAELRAWLDEPVSRAPRRRGWPMPRELRLALPDRPGVYRMLRTSGDVLYVGKATSLRARVNSYFRKQKGIHERTLEMLSQARDLSFVVTESPLEAALLEPDEIKRHRPPYNEALTEVDRGVWFASIDFTARSPVSTAACPIGPFSSPVLLERLAALGRGEVEALGPARFAPPEAIFAEGLARLRAAHAELRAGIDARRALLLGTRLWREGRRPRADDDSAGEAHVGDAGPLFARAWTAGEVAAELETLALEAARAVRRARFLTALVESTVTWTEPGASGPRMLVVAGGAIARREAAPAGEPPASYADRAGRAERAARAERHLGFDVARFDRLRVLGTELKRISLKGYPVTLRLAPRAALSGERLARVLGWL